MRRRVVHPGGLRADGRGGAAFEFLEVDRRVITAPQMFDVGKSETRACLLQRTEMVVEGRARAVCCALGTSPTPLESQLPPRPPSN